jgi:DNA-binding transcriptional MocR family regulator
VSDDTAVDRASIRHAYQQVADAIAARIAAGQYPVRLPAERDLAEEFGVSYPTVRLRLGPPRSLVPARRGECWLVGLVGRAAAGRSGSAGGPGARPDVGLLVLRPMAAGRHR